MSRVMTFIESAVRWMHAFFSSTVFIYITLFFLLALLLYLFYRLLLIVRTKMIERLVYTRSFSETGVHAGDTVLLTEVVYNPTFFPLLYIDVGCYVSTGLEIDGVTAQTQEGLQYFTSRFHLSPYTKITRTHRVRCGVRNHYRLDSIEIFSDKRFIYQNAPAELFVYPESLSDGGVVQPRLNALGNALSRNRFIRDPFQISGIRNYLPGDPFSSINFKASSRYIRRGIREPVVNNPDFTSQLNIMVYMNFSVPRFLAAKTEENLRLLEVGLSYSAGIITEAVRQGGKAGFAANSRGYDGVFSGRYPPAAGNMHMLDIFRSMAMLAPFEGMDFVAMLDRDINAGMLDTDICIITFHVDAELDERIRLFQRFGRGVDVILLR